MNCRKVGLNLFALISIGLVLAGCGTAPTPIPPTPIPPTPTPSTIRFEGELSEANKNVTIRGNVTLSSVITSTSALSVTTEIDTLNHFSFPDLKPGSYHLNIQVRVAPCSLGLVKK